MASERHSLHGVEQIQLKPQLQRISKFVKAGSGLEDVWREEGWRSRGIKDGKRVGWHGWGIVRVRMLDDSVVLA